MGVDETIDDHFDWSKWLMNDLMESLMRGRVDGQSDGWKRMMTALINGSMNRLRACSMDGSMCGRD